MFVLVFQCGETVSPCHAIWWVVPSQSFSGQWTCVLHSVVFAVIRCAPAVQTERLWYWSLADNLTNVRHSLSYVLLSLFCCLLYSAAAICHPFLINQWMNEWMAVLCQAGVVLSGVGPCVSVSVSLCVSVHAKTDKLPMKHWSNAVRLCVRENPRCYWISVIFDLWLSELLQYF